MNIYVAYKLNNWLYTKGVVFRLRNYLHSTTTLNKIANLHKYHYFAYDMEFNAHGIFSLLDGSGFGKNVITFATDMSSSVHADYKKKDVLIFDRDPSDSCNKLLSNTIIF